jgi:hypothetical protein
MSEAHTSHLPPAAEELHLLQHRWSAFFFYSSIPNLIVPIILHCVVQEQSLQLLATSTIAKKSREPHFGSYFMH